MLAVFSAQRLKTSTEAALSGICHFWWNTQPTHLLHYQETHRQAMCGRQASYCLFMASSVWWSLLRKLHSKTKWQNHLPCQLHLRTHGSQFSCRWKDRARRQEKGKWKPNPFFVSISVAVPTMPKNSSSSTAKPSPGRHWQGYRTWKSARKLKISSGSKSKIKETPWKH